MNSFFLNIIRNKVTNRILRSALKRFKSLLPAKFQFPVNGIFKITLNNEKSILLSCNETSHLSRLLYWDGIKGFEYHIYPLFIKLTKNGGVFLDIGSNIGYYSLVACKLNPEIKCYAFEPVEVIYKYLEQNKELNQLKNLNPQNIALSNFIGETSFHTIVNADFSQSEQLTGDGSLKMDYVKELNYKTVNVKTNTLDNFVAENHITQIQLLKIDTEATEDIVIEGGYNTINMQRPVIFCEVLKDQIEEKIENLMVKLNYNFYQLKPNGPVKVKSLLNNEIGNDYLFLPAEREQEIISILKS